MRLNRVASTLVVASLVALVTAPASFAERADDTGRKSKNGMTSAAVDDVKIVIEYGRPKVRERTIFGGLVPYGEVWRTGADEATTFQISGDLEIEGQTLPAGRYSLFTIPGESSWTVIFNSKADQWGAYEYSSAEDVLRVEVTPEAGDMTEEMTFTIEKGRVLLHWAETVVGFSFSAG